MAFNAQNATIQKELGGHALLKCKGSNMLAAPDQLRQQHESIAGGTWDRPGAHSQPGAHVTRQVVIFGLSNVELHQRVVDIQRRATISLVQVYLEVSKMEPCHKVQPWHRLQFDAQVQSD